ncbi:PAS domain-containing protein [Salinigranum halophilum]|uniref:PAS domain-containing protein n=1 Tax=Salinigranum halophilum TaxID=2565931 RepID=UPI00115E1DA2|nr:PAS domain-containing protein [Salinigranum halophilum]
MTEGASDRRLRRSDALRRVTDGIVSLDTGFRYTYVNPQAERILDRPADDLLGRTVWEAFPGTTGTVAETKLESAMATQEQQSFERYNAELDRWFDVRVYPDEGGLTVYFADVTEQKRLERDLAETNRQLTALVENTVTPIYIKDTEGRYRLMNEAAADLFALTPEDAVGTCDTELFDPESVAEISEVDERIVARDEADSREAVRYIDGRRHTFLDDKYPYHDAHGDVVGVMGISRDITARKRRERELQKLSEEYEAVFDNAEDAVFLVDVETTDTAAVFRYERLNPAHEASTGLSTADVQGKTPREVLGEELGGEVVANYQRCVDARDAITYEETLTLPEGQRVWQTKLAPVIIDDEVTRIVGIARDITERVERERELRRKNDRLDEFASVISHDLRNPLNVAQGRTALLLELCDDDYHGHLDPLAESLDRMAAIVADTLTLARQGKSVSDSCEIEVVDLVGQCWGGVETAEASLEIEDEFTIRGDQDRLRHVFENLFRNAVEHAGDTVTVRVGRGDDDSIYVEDDGPGIPAVIRDAVFEPGYTSAAGGTGFGLAIVKRIAEAHGWEVAVVDGRDGGARFEFHGVDSLDD